MNRILIKKLLICIICLLIIPIVFSNKSIAGDYNGTYSSRTDLVNAKQNAVGKTVGFTQGTDYPRYEVLGQFDPNDHMYCVKHNENSQNGLYTIDAYIRIEGNRATGYYIDRGTKKLTALSKTDNSNLAMAYLLNAGNYAKYYDHNGIRNMAVHHFYSQDWFSKVANPVALYADAWYTEYKIGWSNNSESDKEEAASFVKSARRYSNNLTDNAYPEIKATNTEIEYSSNYLGPFSVTYTGKIKSITPVDASGKAINGLKIRQNNADVTDVSQIASGSNFYIQSNINVKKVIVELQSRTVYKADIWFVEKSYSTAQQLITVEGGTTTISGVKAEIIVKDPKGSLTINKKDSRTGEAIRAGFKIKNSSNKWLKGSSGAYTFVDYVENADVYYTNGGTIKIDNLLFDTYTVCEVEGTGGCELKYQDGYIKDKNYTRNNATTWERVVCKKNNSSSIPINENNIDNSINVVNIRGSLYIYKGDEETRSKQLEGAGFKIYYKEEGRWLKGTQYPFEYVSNINDATEYTMDNGNKSKYVEYIEYDKSIETYKGKKVLKIMGLKIGTYHIYETKAPNGGYKLNLQSGYNAQKGYVDTGIERIVGELNANGSRAWNRIADISNVQKISIAGYVWVEGRPDKPEDDTYDSKYIEGSDHRVRDITVKLFKKGNNNPIATTTTNANGYYIFTDVVKRTELDNYYVEFDYKEGKYSYTVEGNTINKTIKDSQGHIRYIPVAFKNIENGSKALSGTIPVNDINVSSVASTYKGTTNVMINTYGLSKIGTMDNVNLVLNNINLGIKEMLEPEFSVVNNIADVDISINNYTYKYKYAGSEVTNNTDFAKDTPEGPAVKWQNSNVSHAYSRPVYPSDVIYDDKSESKQLDVKVKYRIDITNTTTYNVKELYVENKLLLNKITDNYDKNRYTLADTNWSGENGTATINSEYLKKIQTDKNNVTGIGKEQTITAYITFSVNRNAIRDILNHPDGIIENNPTEVSVEGYHEYYRDDYSWENNIKKERQPHKTENSIEKAEAPYLVFTIKPDGGIKERTVSGKVFKDKVTVERGNSGEVVGDGAYQDDEKGISGVKVELLGEDKSLTKLYQLDANTNSDKVVDAIVTTNENGEYNLNGVVPGKYYLRFSYGNGQYKITDLTGTTLKEGIYETKIQGSQETINAKDYKSTIMNSGLVDLIENKAELWYKEDDFKTGKYSIALDDIGKRKNINASDEIKEMSADSSKISVTIENTKSDETQEVKAPTDKEISANNNSGVQNKTLLNDPTKNIKYNFGGFYFGLIEMPKTRADIEKIITNVKITNAQGNILYNGNPEKISKQGAGSVTITDLDNKENQGSSYVRAEMVEASIYGSSLELIYQVNVTNNSDVNYCTENYYLYGKDKSNEVAITPKKVNDYLDLTLEYVEEESTKLNNNTKRINETNKETEIEIDGKTIKAQQYELTGWGKLYTNKIKNRDEEHPTTDKVNLFAKRILSKEDSDMEIVSYATITEVENSTSGENAEENIKLVRKTENVNANAKATFTLTPPTGKTQDSITYYAIAGIISLIVIATGIVIIKKKIV